MTFARLHAIKDRRKPRAMELVPALDQNGMPIERVSTFYSEGVVFLAEMPRFPDKLRPCITQTHLFVLGGILSEHQWMRTDCVGETKPASRAVCVEATRIHTRGDEIVYYVVPKRHKFGQGHSDGYVRRINKKWARLGLMRKTPKTTKMRLMLGLATYHTVGKKLVNEDGSLKQCGVYVPQLRKSKLPMHWVNNAQTFPLY